MFLAFIIETVLTFSHLRRVMKRYINLHRKGCNCQAIRQLQGNKSMPKREKKPREYRGVIDEIREQQRKTQDMTRKGKLEYFWYYYKVHTIAGIFILIMVITLIHDMVTAKDFIFNCVMVNSFQLQAQTLENSFAEYAGLDLDEYDCYIDTSTSLSLTTYDQYNLGTVQKIMAQMQSGDLDVLVFNSEIFNNYSLNGMFMDLRTVMTEDELEKYKDQLYYVDYAEVVRKSEEELDADELMEPMEVDVEADTLLHRHPEDMEDPMPIGVFLTDSPFIEKTESYHTSLQPVFGIVATCKRTEIAKQYLNFLWDDTIDFTQMIDTELF